MKSGPVCFGILYVSAGVQNVYTLLSEAIKELPTKAQRPNTKTQVTFWIDILIPSHKFVTTRKFKTQIYR